MDSGIKRYGRQSIGIRTTATTTDGTLHSSNGDWAYGAMAVVNLGKRIAVRAEYEYIGVSCGDFDVGTLNAVFKS